MSWNVVLTEINDTVRQFVVRSVREPQVMDVFRCVMTSEAFGNVGRDGHTGLANLIAENELIVAAKSF